MSILLWLAAHVGALGPFAMLGGPAGVAIAWCGSFVANKSVKLIAVCIGLLLLVSVSVGLTLHIEHLEQDRAALQVARAEISRLEAHFDCAAMPEGQRELATCIAEREALMQKAKAEEIIRQRTQAALEQAALDRRQHQADEESSAMQALIDADARSGDGPVPPVLRNTWARERKERGLK